MGELVICDGMMFFIQVLYGFECLYVYKRLEKLWGRIWALGNQKLGFWGENGVFPESKLLKTVTTRHGELEASWRRVDSVTTRHGE